MKKILLLLIIFSASPSFAEECSLKSLGLGEKFDELKDKYPMGEDTFDKKYFYSNLRGTAICKDLAGAELKMTFVNQKLAEILIEKKSDSQELLELSSDNFGEPQTLPNNDSQEVKDFATYWNDDEKVVTYSFDYLPEEKLYREKIILQDKKLSEKLHELSSVDEDEKVSKKEKD